MSETSDFTIVDVGKFLGTNDLAIVGLTYYLRPRELRRLETLKASPSFITALCDKSDEIDVSSVLKAILFSKSALVRNTSSIYGLVDSWVSDIPLVTSAYWDFIDDVIKGRSTDQHRIHEKQYDDYFTVDDDEGTVMRHIGDYDPEVDPRRPTPAIIPVLPKDPAGIPTPSQPIVKPQTENQTMTKVTAVVASNKQAVTTAAKIKAGNVLNAATIAAIKKSKAVPMMLRGYLDSPFAPLVVANLALMASTYTTNPKAKQAVQLMMDSAALTVANQIDIEGIVASLIDNPAVAGVLAGEE